MYHCVHANVLKICQCIDNIENFNSIFLPLENKNTTISRFLYLCPTVMNLNEDANILYFDAVRPGRPAVLFCNNVPVRCK